jgi:hypothetical protein
MRQTYVNGSCAIRRHLRLDPRLLINPRLSTANWGRDSYGAILVGKDSYRREWSIPRDIEGSRGLLVNSSAGKQVRSKPAHSLR